MMSRPRLIMFVSIFFGVDCSRNTHTSGKLLNVSYDPTREFFREYNQAFQAYYQKKTGILIEINTSHSGSGKQARAVIDGLDADVVSLALAYDVDTIADEGRLLPVDWQKRFPANSAPYTSTMVFLVRKGNPKAIRDWIDLIRPGVSVIAPNPKTSGGARWNYLAAWTYAETRFGKDEKQIFDFVAKLYQNVSVLDTGARAATTTFAQRMVGDVWIGWENEAFLALRELGKDRLEVIVPSVSILAEPTVAVVEKNATRKGNIESARAYLEYLYSDEGQALAARNFFRPRNSAIENRYSYFKKLKLVTVDQAFGGWKNAQRIHFSDGGTFDQIYAKKHFSKLSGR